MKYEELLQKLEYLSIDQVQNPKLEVEDLIKISPTLHSDNPMTFMLYLHYRPDLPEDEKELIQNLITLLQRREQEGYEIFLNKFE